MVVKILGRGTSSIAWWTVVYAAVACLLGLVNKALVEWYHFRAFNILTVVTRVLALPLIWGMASGKMSMMEEVVVVKNSSTAYSSRNHRTS